MARTPLSDDVISERLKALPGWERDGDWLTKTYRMTSYMAGLAFAAAVGTLAEAHDHHPEITIGYKTVTVRYNTHDAGDKITATDFDAAARIEGLGYPKG